MTGHRPSYLRRVTEIALAQGIKVIIAMPPECFQHPVAVQLVNRAADEELHAVHCDLQSAAAKATQSVGMLLREIRHRAFYRQALLKVQQQHQIDVAVILMFDDVVMVSSFAPPNLGQIPWVGIVMRQKFHLETMGAVGPANKRMLKLKCHLFVRLLKKISDRNRILTIDQSLVQFVANTYPECKEQIAYIPDPVDDRRELTNTSVRVDLGIPDSAFVLLAYGTLREGKGVKLLLNLMHDLPENVHALLVGTQAPDIKAFINQPSHQSLFTAKRVHQVDRYIDVSEDPNFFTPADVVWLAYEKHYAMSAVMIQAAQYQRPTIATKHGLIGILTRKYKTGCVVDAGNDAELKDAVHRLMRKDFSVKSQDYNALANDHSLATFETLLMSSLSEISDR